MTKMTSKKMVYRAGCLALGCVAFLLMCPGITLSQDLPSEVIAYADMVLYNGKILTVDEAFSIVEAVAVRDGKILATGSSSRILPMAGPDTQRIDLRGRSVTPGLMSTHEHGWVGQLSKSGLEGNVFFSDVEAGLEEVRKLVEATPPGEWIFLSGVRNKVFLTELTRQDLDRVSPNNPVALHGSTAETVVNTLAMKAAGIKPGIVGVLLDDNGEPTGQLRQAAVGIITYEMKPNPWPEDLSTLVARQKERLFQRASEGLTTQMGRAQGLTISVLRELWDSGELPIRVRVAHEFPMYNPNAEAYFRRVGNLRNLGDDWMKIFGATVGPVDGVLSVGGIMSNTPKLRDAEVIGGDVFGAYGQNKWAQLDGMWEENFEEFSTERKALILANRYGWNITSLHSTGDLSAEVYLDAVEEANREKTLQGPWGFDHNVFLNPEVLARSKNLGAMRLSFKTQGLFGNPETLLHQYGADRLQDNTVMLNSAIEAGLTPTPDSLGSGGHPFAIMQEFITRTDEKGRQWNVKEAINRVQALRMYTTWAARYIEDEDKLGSIEPGKLADMVVLNGGDFMRVPDEQLSELEVAMTIVGGKVVYDRQRDGVIERRQQGGQQQAPAQ